MADFIYSPDFGYKIAPDYNVLTKRYANSVDQTRLVSSKKIRKLDLSFGNRTLTELNAAIAFFDSKYGALTSFSINIDGADITGRFVSGSFWHQRIAPSIYSYGFQFEEVI